MRSQIWIPEHMLWVWRPICNSSFRRWRQYTQSKTASKTSHADEIWFNLINKANNGITWDRAIPSINLRPLQNLLTFLCTRKHLHPHV